MLASGYFDHCVFHTITNIYSGSYNLTAARTVTSGVLSATTPWLNPNGTTYSAYGFSFVNCTFEADAGVDRITLAGSNGTAGGLDSWVNCLIDTNAYVTPTAGLSNTYVFWQYNNTDITGINPISFASVQTIGVTNNDPRLLAATNVPVWFSGWTPAIGAQHHQPAGRRQTVSAGPSANFTRERHRHSQSNLSMVPERRAHLPARPATNYLTSPAQCATNAGNYTVVVSNGSGSVTSVVATLTYTGNVAAGGQPVHLFAPGRVLR